MLKGQEISWPGRERQGWGSCASYRRCRRGLGRGSAQPAARRQKACGQITMSQSGLLTLLPWLRFPRALGTPTTSPGSPSQADIAGLRD